MASQYHEQEWSMEKRKRRSRQVSQTDPTPTDPQEDTVLAAAHLVENQSREAFDKVVERITPWLMEIGNWVFAGLIGFTLVIMGPLITIGPADRAILVSTVAFALALPLNVAGLVLLRLVQDTARIGLADEWVRAFQDAGFPIGEQIASAQTLEVLQRRRTRVALLYSLGMLTLSVLLTLTGLIAVLWHMASWIGIAFFAMVIISLGAVLAAFATVRSPESREQKEQYRRYWDEIMKRAKEQSEMKNKNA